MGLYFAPLLSMAVFPAFSPVYPLSQLLFSIFAFSSVILPGISITPDGLPPFLKKYVEFS
ncbi:hypothetical protein AB77_5254 [Escherichia coli 3-373-03_S1_C3]|nr:hypothetical protein AB77_5254 [Escherichia coli 3-373-03_S1_C3]